MERRLRLVSYLEIRRDCGDSPLRSDAPLRPVGPRRCPAMIGPGLSLRLGLSQLVSWGISYYLIAIFGDAITRDFGWPMPMTYSGFSGALIIMSLTSGFVGRLIDAHGGRPVMTGGSLLLAAGCLGLSQSRDLLAYDLSWACIGLGMRMTLYEAAFAAVARIGGMTARRAMSQITLLGGLASSVFWPIGHLLSDALGWRGAVAVYALFALGTACLHLTIPAGRYAPGAGDPPEPLPLARTRWDERIAGASYILIIAVTGFLGAGMSAHMIGIMSGLGMGAGLAVWLSTLRGIGQSSARLCEVVFGRRLPPPALALLATGFLPIAFGCGLAGAGSAVAGALFALAFGAGNGLLTIARGTLPLVLFGHRSYGGVAGRLTAPAFFASALAPVVYSGIIEAFGAIGALHVSLALAALALAAAALLRWRFRAAPHPSPV